MTPSIHFFNFISLSLFYCICLWFQSEKNFKISMKRHSAVALEICESHKSMMCVLYHASIVSFSTFFHIFDILRNLWRFLSSVILHYIRYLAIEFLLIRWLLGTYYHIVAYVFICSTGFILLCALSGLFTIRNGFFNVMTKRINVKESWKNNIVHGKPNTRHDNNKAISNKRKNEERERERKSGASPSRWSLQ